MTEDFSIGAKIVRDHFDRERVGLRRLLYALPIDQRQARYAEVAKLWGELRSRRIRLTDSNGGVGFMEWPDYITPGGVME